MDSTTEGTVSQSAGAINKEQETEENTGKIEVDYNLLEKMLAERAKSSKFAKKAFKSIKESFSEASRHKSVSGIKDSDELHKHILEVAELIVMRNITFSEIKTNKTFREVSTQIEIPILIEAFEEALDHPFAKITSNLLDKCRAAWKVVECRLMFVECTPDKSLPVVDIYTDENDIPVHNEDAIKPINIPSLGIPDGNLILKIINYISGITDTYTEYAMQSALSVLSTVTRRRLYVRVNSRELYPNLWQGNLGFSTYSRKSASMDIAVDIVENAIGKLYLPKDLNPESLLESMATRITDRKKDGETEDRPLDALAFVKRSQRTFVKDEIGQLFGLMNKPTHAHFKETMLTLHSGRDYDKDLVSKKIVIEEPYLPMYWSTTIETIQKHMTKGDIKSGWLGRTIMVSPTYEKPRKPVIEDDDSDIAAFNSIVDDIRKINKILDNTNLVQNAKPLRVRFQQGVLEMLDSWVAERELYYFRLHDETSTIFVGRFQENAIRIAMLIELGNIPAMNLQDDATIERFEISMNSMGVALKLIDTVYMPYAQQIASTLKDDLRGSGDSDGSNAIANLQKLLSTSLKAPKRDIQRDMGVYLKQFNNCIQAIYAVGGIEFCVVIDSQNKKERWLVHVPTSQSKIGFTYDFVNRVVKEYTCGITFGCLPSFLKAQPNILTEDKEDSQDW